MTEAVNVLIGKVVDLLFGVAKREIGYMWNCTQNIENLNKEVEKHRQMRERVQLQINSAKKNGDDLIPGVQVWMDGADARISMADDLIKEEAASKKSCFNLHVCVNLSTLHHYGKKANNLVSYLHDHQLEGKDFIFKVSNPACAPGIIDLYQPQDLDDLATHKSVLEEIVKAIEDESIQIIGIYGIGGVGKTTLAKEAAARVKNQFADVVFVTVSQTDNVEKIKNKVEVAALRIRQGDKILIILDDIWRKIELEVLIPCGTAYKNCKILLTSRKINVYESMKCEKKIHVDSLPEEEAWSLFKSVVGERVESDANLKEIAVKVAKKCGGLPLFIQVVGNALKERDVSYWEAALNDLGKHAPSNIDKEIRDAYTRLKLSYDLLENKNAQACFLLCSVFPEDSSIAIEHLVYFGVGLEKFNDFDSLEDARNQVQLAVTILKNSCLLLDGNDKFQVGMHDVVHDVALLIASEDNNKFLVEAGKCLTEWQPRNNRLQSHIGISLMQNNISKLPDYEIQFPLLDYFLISRNYLSVIPNEFIPSIKNVKVLDVHYNKICSLPQSLGQLTRLRMLNLRRNTSLREVSILGELKALEILFLGWTGIEEIPKEMGQLINLRVLEVKKCKRLSYIAPGVISKLRHLEELHIGLYSYKEEEGKYNSLVEIHGLSKLTFLFLFVPRVSLFPEGYHFERLKRFDIKIGYKKLKLLAAKHDFSFEFGVSSESKLVLLDMSYLSILSFVRIIKVSQSLTLKIVENLNNILPAISYEYLQELKSLTLDGCDIICLIDSTDADKWQNFIPSKGLDDGGELKEFLFHKLEHLSLKWLSVKVMWKCPDQYISLKNLVTLTMEGCHKLVRLFTVNIACRLVNLQKLDIIFCSGLKELIWDTNEETGKSEINIVVHATKTVFPSLAMIYLLDLRNLTSFHTGNSIIKFPSLVTVEVCQCDMLDEWGNGTYETPKLERVNNVERPSTIDEGLAKYREEEKRKGK